MASEPNYSRVAASIRSGLLAGEFRPGQRMKVVELAARYATGPNTVREALQQLSGEGWLHIEPNRGAVVRPLTREVIEDVYELLDVLSRCTARKFVHNASNRDLERLNEIQNDFDQAARDGDHERCSLCNRTFHALIESRAGNEEIAQTIERYSRLIGPIRRFVGYGEGRAEKVAGEHHELIAAFKRRDGDAAERIMSLHLKSSCADILRHLVRVGLIEGDEPGASLLSIA